jgi:hypothetical protein
MNSWIFAIFASFSLSLCLGDFRTEIFKGSFKDAKSLSRMQTAHSQLIFKDKFVLS